MRSSLIPLEGEGEGRGEGSYSLKSRVELSVKAIHPWHASGQGVLSRILCRLSILLPSINSPRVVFILNQSRSPNLQHTMYKRSFSIIAFIGGASSDQHLVDGHCAYGHGAQPRACKQHGYIELHCNHALRFGRGSTLRTWNRKTI
jgi:hypothetical protein